MFCSPFQELTIFTSNISIHKANTTHYQHVFGHTLAHLREQKDRLHFHYRNEEIVKEFFGLSQNIFHT